jgi:beta-lactamase class D
LGIYLFALCDVAQNATVTVNGSRAEKRYVPAPIFKIANGLIALEVGAVKDENEIIPYDGQPHPFKSAQRCRSDQRCDSM